VDADTVEVIYRLVGIAIAFIVIALAFRILKTRLRGSLMTLAAWFCRLSYQGEQSQALISELRDLPLFSLAHSGQSGAVSNVMTGKVEGSDLTACDYVYWSDAETTRRKYAQTVVCFSLAPGVCPVFALHVAVHFIQRVTITFPGKLTKPIASVTKDSEHAKEDWDRANSKLDRQHRELMEAIGPRFVNSDLWKPDEKWIEQLMLDLARERRMRYDTNPLSVECSGRWLIIYVMNRLIGPHKMPFFLSHCVGLKGALLERLSKPAINSTRGTLDLQPPDGKIGQTPHHA